MLTTKESYAAIRHTAAVYNRGGEVLRLTGTHRVELLSWLLAKQTEFAEPGTVVESLILDETGNVEGSALVVLDDEAAVVIADSQTPLLPIALAAIESLGLEGTFAEDAEDLAAVLAIEGPLSWQVAEDITEDPISEILLNEWRRGTLNGTGCLLVRIGTTAEYGYLVVTSAAGGTSAFDRLVDRAQGVGGGRIDKNVLHRAQAEVNHPVLPSQAQGLNIFEAGIQWMATPNRDDEYRGKAGVQLQAPGRKIVAAVSDNADFPEAGTTVTDEGITVGRVQTSTARAGLNSGFGLLLLDVPYCVPGLTLAAGGRSLSTVARPAVDPQSWTQQIGG
ncbi:aminomethyl transferase family protein [Pseudarthrobacter sp. 1G09]|uniref:aminomethyl transferase family protein n=1 Tax=Pseudarthrobacter sp. 1G09 TaxID=3416178 RepID=UPI003CF07C34